MDLHGEKKLLARILCDYRILNEIRIKRMLEPDDFSSPANGKIFSAMCDVVKEGNRLDVVTLVEKLRKNGTYEESGGATYLADLLESIGPEDAGEEALPITVKDLREEADEYDIAWENFAELFPGSARKQGNSVKGPIFESLLSFMKTNPADSPFSTVVKDNQPRNLVHHLGAMKELLDSQPAGPGLLKVTLTELAITPGSCAERKEELMRIRREREAEAWQAQQEAYRKRASEHEKQKHEAAAAQEQKRVSEAKRLGPALESLCNAVVSILDQRAASPDQVEALTKSVRHLSFLTRHNGGYPMEDAVGAFLERMKENERLYAKREITPVVDDTNEVEVPPESSIH